MVLKRPMELSSQAARYLRSNARLKCPSHRSLHTLRADHDRSGFRTVLVHNDEDLAPNCELVGRCLVKGDNRRARWDGDRLFSAFVVKHEHAVRSDLLDLKRYWRWSSCSAWIQDPMDSAPRPDRAKIHQ